MNAARLAFLLALVPSVAAGQERAKAWLEWERGPGAEECIAPEDVMVGVERRLGRAVFVPEADSDVRVRGRVERRADGSYSAILRMSGRDGRRLGLRELESDGPTCRELDASVILVVALAVDVDPPVVVPPPHVEAPPPAPRPPPVRATPTHRPRRQPPAPWRGELALGVATAVGLLPGIALGVRLSGRLQPPRLPPIGMAATYWPQTEAGDEGGGARVSSGSIALVVCPIGSRLTLCGGMETGWLAAQGIHLDSSGEATRFLLDAVLQASLAIGRQPGVRAALGFGVPFVRDRFFYYRADGSRAFLHRVWPVLVEISLSGRFEIGR